MGFFDSIGSVAGPIIGGLANFMGQKSANETNQEIASTNNATSIELANTAMQRKVTDLKAAGLNPMLAYSQGGSATPPLQQAKVENSAASGSSGSLNAATQALIAAQVKNQESQATLNSAQTAKTTTENAGLSMDNQLKTADLPNIPYRVETNLKELDARFTKAVSDRFISSLEQNTQDALNDRAKKMGFNTWREATSNADFRKIVADTARQSQEYNIAKPHEIFAQGAYGKNVAPYVHDASKAVNLLNAFKSGYSGGR